MVTLLTFLEVERLVELTLFSRTKVALTPRDLRYATTAAFLALPNALVEFFARLETRVKVMFDLPRMVSTKSRRTNFWAALRVDFPGLKKTLADDLVL
jgi:hypothetical protein